MVSGDRNLNKTIEKIFEQLHAMSDEEFKEMLEEAKTHDLYHALMYAVDYNY